MEHHWIKATLIPEVAVKDMQGCDIWRVIFMGPPSLRDSTRPLKNLIGNNFTPIEKVNVILK